MTIKLFTNKTNSALQKENKTFWATKKPSKEKDILIDINLNNFSIQLTPHGDFTVEPKGD